MRSRLVVLFALGCGGSAPAPVVAPSQPAVPPPAPAEPSTMQGDPATRRHPTFGEGNAPEPLWRDATAAQDRAASLTWQELGPARRYALASGSVDATFGALVEIKAGSAAFWHMHGRDVEMVVLAGTIDYVESGQAKHTLERGAYVLQPGGYKHTENCVGGIDCVLYVRGDRGFVTKPM